MRGHGQLADMYLCISRVPSLVKVMCPPHSVQVSASWCCSALAVL